MRLTLPCAKVAGHLLALLILLALSFCLIITPEYFALTGIDRDFRVGLMGMEVNSGVVDYDTGRRECETAKVAVCEYLPDFQTAGKTLVVSLVLLIALEAVCIVHLGLTQFLLTVTLRALSQGVPVPRFVPSLTRILSVAHFATFLHPLFTVFAVISYPIEAHFAEISAKFRLCLKSGLVILIAKSALSLLFFAGICLCILDNRRRNNRLLKGKRKSETTITSEKVVAPAHGSFDDTRMI